MPNHVPLGIVPGRNGIGSPGLQVRGVELETGRPEFGVLIPLHHGLAVGLDRLDEQDVFGGIGRACRGTATPEHRSPVIEVPSLFIRVHDPYDVTLRQVVVQASD